MTEAQMGLDFDATARIVDVVAPGLARADHPETAKQAAAQAKTGKTRRFVYDMLNRRGWAGATDEEIITAGIGAGFTANGLRPRRVELVRDGVVVDAHRKRRTQSGRNAIVWVLDYGK